MVMEFTSEYIAAARADVNIYAGSDLVKNIAFDALDEIERLQELIDLTFSNATETIERLQQRIAELEQERRWIPVSERLPEEEQEALVSYGDGNWIISAYIYDGKWFDIPYDSPISPTHWQPLPQDPQEEE